MMRLMSGMFCICLLVSMVTMISPQVQAVEYDVQILPGGFAPSNLSIIVGDSIRFINFTGMTVTVYPTTSFCPYWGFMLPYPGQDDNH